MAYIDHEATMKIEKGVSAPCAEPKTATFAKMEVGDSIFIPGENGGGLTVRNARSWGYKTTPRIKFSARREAGGCRMWRVA